MLDLFATWKAWVFFVKNGQVFERAIVLWTMFNPKRLADLYLHRNNCLFSAFIDYKKAFDCVNRLTLWQTYCNET